MMKFVSNFMKSKNSWKLILLILVLIVLGFLYRRFEDKRLREEKDDDYEYIQNYLLEDKQEDLVNSKKPILWIHIPYEYNSRKWLSFGSRSSLDLNQPYLYLTVKTIMRQCNKSFKICFIDDNSFTKLIPNWNIDLSKLSPPILNNIRELGLMKLLYRYGGLICPISFLCIKDLIDLYEKGTRGEKMFLCEMYNRNITSTNYPYYPNLSFSGSTKENPVVKELINFIQRISSTDFTAQSEFLGDFNRWCQERIKHGQIKLIPAAEIGVKTLDSKPVLIEDLLSQQYLKLYPDTYGLYIPADEILKRKQYEWFPRLSEKQVLESNTIIGNYLLLYNSPSGGGFLEPMENKPDWVSFWKVPSGAPVWGLKPIDLGDNIISLKYPQT